MLRCLEVINRYAWSLVFPCAVAVTISVVLVDIHSTPVPIKLAPGKYYWRSSNRESKPAQSVVAPPAEYHLLSPNEHSKLNSDQNVRLEWKPQDQQAMKSND